MAKFDVKYTLIFAIRQFLKFSENLRWKENYFKQYDIFEECEYIIIKYRET